MFSNWWLGLSLCEFYAKRAFEHFNQGRYGYLPDEDKEKLCKRSYRVSKVMNRSALGLLIFSFLVEIKNPFPQFPLDEWAILACIIYPLTTFIVIKLSNGLIQLAPESNSIYPSVLSVFGYCVFRTVCNGIGYCVFAYSLKNLWLVMTAIVIVLFVLYFLCASRDEKEKRHKRDEQIYGIVCLLLVFGLYSFGATMYINLKFDKSEPKIYEVTVENQRVSDGKSDSYYFTVSPWIDGKNESKEIRVARKLYNKTKVGDEICIELYSGRLGIPWFIALDLPES